jgi:hypothetical protein
MLLLPINQLELATATRGNNFISLCKFDFL